MLICTNGTVELSDVENACLGMPGLEQGNSVANISGLSLEEIERAAVLNAIDKHPGNLSNAAMELGITRQSLYRRMEKYGIKQ